MLLTTKNEKEIKLHAFLETGIVETKPIKVMRAINISTFVISFFGLILVLILAISLTQQNLYVYLGVPLGLMVLVPSILIKIISNITKKNYEKFVVENQKEIFVLLELEKKEIKNFKIKTKINDFKKGVNYEQMLIEKSISQLVSL